MANLSDAFGTITVQGVGKEFLAYAMVAAEAYYNLAGTKEELAGIKPADDLQFEFSTFGRWSYGYTLEKYLDPEGFWHNAGAENEAYNELHEAILKTGGSVYIEYADSDPAMDWKGRGEAHLFALEGVVHYDDTFTNAETVAEFAKMTDQGEDDVIGFLHGTDVNEKWEAYKTNHPSATFEVWYDEVYEDTE